MSHTFLLTCYFGYSLKIPIWSGILLSSTSWIRADGKLYKNQIDPYRDSIPERYDVLRNERKRRQRYDDEEYPSYEAPPVNWILRSKYPKLWGNRPSRHNNPSRMRKPSSPNSYFDQYLTTKPRVAMENDPTNTKTIVEKVTTTTKLSLNQRLVPSDDPRNQISITRTTSLPRRRTFTNIQTVQGVVIKRTMIEEILEGQDRESLASYATVALITLVVFSVMVFVILGIKNKVKHKICGRKLQNRRHTFLEAVASSKLSNSTGNKESNFFKGTKDGKDLKKNSRKKKLQDPSEQKHLFGAADDSDEEYSVLANNSKNFHHAEA